MEGKKISRAEKQKLQELLIKQNEDRLKRIVERSDDDRAGLMLFIFGGFMGRSGFAIVLLLYGTVNILLGGVNLLLLPVIIGVGFVTVGIMNLKRSVYEVLLINGIFLAWMSVIHLANCLMLKSIGSFIYFAIMVSLSIYFIRWHVQRTRWLRSKGQK